MTEKNIPMFKPFIPKQLDMNVPLNYQNITFGKFGRLFEDALKKYIENDYTLTFVNYNIAYFTLLTALKIKQGDVVLVSPLACLESLQPLKAYGLQIKFIDVDKENGMIDINFVKESISNNARLLVINHYLGNVSDIDVIAEATKKSNLSIIHDCNEAFGSTYNNMYLGNEKFNSNFIFNFSAVRNPNTITGAAVCFQDENVFYRGYKIRDNGIDRAKFRLEDGEINPQCDINMIGYSGIMNELSSYLGYMQMQNISNIFARQKKIAQKWHLVLEKFFPEVELSFYENLENPNFWVFGFHTSNIKLTRAKLTKIGFSSSQVHINNNIYSVFLAQENLENCTSFMKSFLAVPTGWWVDDNLLEPNRINALLNY